MIENICTQTNLYHLQETGKEGVFTKTDINQFIGSYFLMGLVRMPSVRSYWENGMRCSGIADVMSRNKFETLLRHLHFVNNLGVTDETKKSTKLWKLKSWLSSLRENFLKVSPEEFQSVDEISSLQKIATLKRPSLTNFSRKRKREHKQPNVPVDVRKDDVGHMPIWDNKRNRCGYCKDNKFSYVKCGKCNVWLCFNKERACYGDYHE